MTLSVRHAIAATRQVARPLPAASGASGATLADARPDAAWDALIEGVPGGDLVQTTAWAGIRQRLGTGVGHLRVQDGDGMLVGGCLIQHRQVLPGIRIGAVPRGPLVLAGRPGAAERVVRETIAAARRLGIRLLVVQPPDGGAALEDALAAAGFRLGAPAVAPTATARLDLRRSEAQLFGALNATRRNRVRFTQRNGLETAVSDDVEAFHRLHAASAARKGYRPLSLENLKAQWEALAPRGMCRIVLTRHGGVPVAGEWFTVFGGQWTSKLVGFDHLHPSPAVRDAPTGTMWGSILEARRAGAARFDFGGFDRSHAEALLAGQEAPPGFNGSPSYFKRSFGSEVALLPMPRFILTGRIAQAMLAGLLQRLLAGDAARRFAQAIRAAQ